jgi:L-ascorbate metabolism protein UlaG (beta-lactamase superfamily)
MEITWYGHSCFRIVERGRATIVTDPFDAAVIGYNPLRLKADIVLVSHDTPGHSHVAAVQGYQHVLTNPGEYEIGGVFVIGAAMYDKNSSNPRRNVVYVMDFLGVTIAHLGDLDHIPHQSAIDALGNIDVVLIPVGGGGALNSSEAAEVISLLEPKIVVPMHYKTPNTLLELDPVERFLKEMGINTPVEEESLRVSASSFPEQTQVILLQIKE